MTTEPNQDLEWTGERYVPQLRGTIALEHLHRYAYASEYVKDKVILDIASGEGYGSDMLSRTAKHVYGVDVDPVSVAHARAKYSSEKLNFREGSCTEIPLEDQSVDVVVSFETIEHITDHEKMMTEVKRVLRPGGILIISSPEKHEYSEVPQHHNPFHLKELDQEEFLGLLNKHFKYSAFLGQRVIYGSALVEMEKPSGTAKTYQVDDLPQQIEAASGLPRPIYLIGVCSDHPIQAASGGVCEQNIHQSEPVHAYQKIIMEKESVIAEKEGVIAEKEGVIAEKEGVIAKKEGIIREIQSRIDQRDHDLHHLRAYLDLVKSSLSWRLTAPLRAVKEKLSSIENTLNRYLMAARVMWIHQKAGTFDQEWYLHNNLDVKESGINPLWHFAMWGIHEGRANIIIREKELKNEKSQGLQSIAVIAHIYYPELFESIANDLNNIPLPFDIYISTTDVKNKSTIAKKAKNIRNVKKITILITENRGRDIAPLLVSFGDVIPKHEYILHIHTKKSLYTGIEQVEWRDYLIKGLIGSKRIVRTIIYKLESNKRVGIIYPETFDKLPYWAHTWLKNRGIANELCEKIGIDIEFKNYIDAPMGSMFWARGDALRPLLELNLKIDDFAKESGQTDGTLHHTIERLFVSATGKAGYDFCVISTNEKGEIIFKNPGHKNLQKYYLKDKKKEIIENSFNTSIVSFDVFDTLLVRPWFSPKNLFSYINYIAKNKYKLENFYDIRISAEKDACEKAGIAHVNIDMIYDFIAVQIKDNELSEKLKKIECNLEISMLQKRKDICDSADELFASGKHIVLISDMYLDKSTIKNILQKNKINFYKNIYISNEIGARKDTGEMWTLLPKIENKSPKSWLHVGDNEHSDIQRPIDIGFMPPVHIMRSADEFSIFNDNVKEFISPNLWQEGLILGLISNRIFLPGLSFSPIIKNPSDFSIEIKNPSDFGYLTVGPILSVFMAWVLKSSMQDPVEVLLYASREGFLLKKAHDIISAYFRNSNQKIIDGEYFLCSRSLCGLAAISDIDSFDNLLGAHFKGTLKDLLLNRFCIANNVQLNSRLSQEELCKTVELPTDLIAIKKLLAKCSDIILDNGLNTRVKYLQYATQLLKDRKAAIVDIGYGATIQKSLSKILSSIRGGYYFVTTQNAADVQLTNNYAKGCFADGISSFDQINPFFKYSLLFESVMTAPHGQLTGFDDFGIAQFKESNSSQYGFDTIEQIQEGALDFLRDVIHCVGDNFLEMGSNHLSCYIPIIQVMNKKWRLDFDSKIFDVEDDFSGNGNISIFDFYENK